MNIHIICMHQVVGCCEILHLFRWDTMGNMSHSPSMIPVAIIDIIGIPLAIQAYGGNMSKHHRSNPGLIFFGERLQYCGWKMMEDNNCTSW